MTPTGLPPTAARQVEAVVDLLQRVLGDDATAAYLYGSAVDGGLRPRSDLDVFGVSSRPTTVAERAELLEGLRSISGRETGQDPRRAVELTLVARPAIQPWRYPPSMELQWGEWLRPAFEAGNDRPWDDPNPDLAILLTMVRNRGRVLLGPPVADVVDAVPRADLVRAMLAGVPGLVADAEDDTRNVLLTLPRIWTTIVTGDVRSKDAAATWALDRLPEEHRPVLARARAVYLGDAPEGWDDVLDRVRAHADHMAIEIARAADATTEPPMDR